MGRWVEDAPAWLVSGMLHLGLLVLFALLAMGVAKDDRLSLTVGLSEDLGEQMIEESLDLTTATEIELDEQVLTPDTLPEVANPLATPPVIPIDPTGLAFSSELPSVTPGAALSGREPGRKEALLKAMGATAQTETAVLEGLRWLARVQQNDGGWSLVGKYPNPAANENREAATAMALIAFQGAGKLPSNSKMDFGQNVARGWRWLLGRQEADGSFFHSGGSNHRFYTHAQCTIALCELLAMTGDEQYRKPAQLAVKYLIDTQTDLGGWRYNPGVQSDLSVTGWVLMALKSARMAGIEVPSPVFAHIEGFLDLVSRSDPVVYAPLGSRYVYEEPDIFNREAVPTLTAVGLLSREYLGWPTDDKRIDKGVEFLLTHKPEWRRGKTDVYYWYYATQAIFHAGGPRWTEWNKVMRELLPAQQSKDGRDRGSWDPREDAWGASGGRLYMTCMAIYTLEVYYRHLPLYQQRAVR
ncbi:Prenyltransferase and squalene oxidase repeat protein [Botrimarina colliarenosi]|uniref:Prenyltransferase and squalene oxidase repeat protein n=1 Tax=Botrimarina colliarenosi TaxID=2528001 RepID=A0A5C6AC17_9BACT|nr:Prenyltransferase and squalene oxidase repeat protein [Botrimarina colliarenosi]